MELIEVTSILVSKSYLKQKQRYKRWEEKNPPTQHKYPNPSVFGRGLFVCLFVD